MGNCKDCKHWGVYRESCCDWTDYSQPKSDPSTHFEVDAYALDDTGLDVWFKTQPMFGCVQFQPKRSVK